MRPRTLPSRSAAALGATALLGALALAGAVTARGDDGRPGTGSIPSATVTVADIAQTQTVAGSFQHAWTADVVDGMSKVKILDDPDDGGSAAAAPADSGAAASGDSATAVSGDSATVATQSSTSSTGPPAVRPVAFMQPATHPSTIPTQSPSASPSSGHSSSPQPSPAPSPAPTPSASPSASPSAAPSALPSAGTNPPGAGSGAAAPRPSSSGAAAPGQGIAGAPGQAAASGTGTARIVTALAPLGAEVRQGTRLYSADGEPVVSILGNSPMWRNLKVGVRTGPDVKQLEHALVALGYGDGLSVDGRYSSDTADAVRAWEKDLGRPDPDGVVDVSDLVAVPSAAQVAEHSLSVGDAIKPGSTAISVSSRALVVRAAVDTNLVKAWTPGRSARVEPGDGEPIAARVSEVGRDVEGATVQVTLSVGKSEGSRRSGADATVRLTTRAHRDVATVPVAALQSGHDGGYAVRFSTDQGSRLVAVTIGIVADGRVEILSGLSLDQRVLLPG